jgi:hypothetical protein
MHQHHVLAINVFKHTSNPPLKSAASICALENICAKFNNLCQFVRRSFEQGKAVSVARSPGIACFLDNST